MPSLVLALIVLLALTGLALRRVVLTDGLGDRPPPRSHLAPDVSVGTPGEHVP